MSSPTRNVLFRTVPAFCAPLIGSNSDSMAATLPKRRQSRISRRHIRQFRRHGRRLEVEGGKTLRPAQILAGTGEQPLNPNRHVAEQGAECRDVMTFAGQNASASLAPAATITDSGCLHRDHLRLERCCKLLGLRKPEPEVGQANPFIALQPRDLHLRRQAALQFRNQLHSPNHLRHQLILVPMSPNRTLTGTNPTALHALRTSRRSFALAEQRRTPVRPPILHVAPPAA
jgi:hypothetical protein